MKIVHHSNLLGMGGTEKCMQYFLEYLKGAGHDCYCMHKRQVTDALGSHREGLIKDLLGECKVLAYSSEEDFFRILDNIRPDIFHIHRSGRPNEFPIVPRLKSCMCKCVETNIFGGVDHAEVIDLTLYINKTLLKSGRSLKRAKRYLYNPVKLPAHGRDLRRNLGIPKATFVMGRIGRPDDYIFDPISLNALKTIEEKRDYDILYLVQSPPPLMVKTAQDLGIKNVRFLSDPIVTDDEITSFFNTIDILAHARRDGETFGLNIAEAMIHCKPVISHKSRIANGHKAFVKNCGFFAGTDNHRQYAKYIAKLYENRELRSKLGKKGRKFAEENFLLDKLGQKLLAHYKELTRGSIEGEKASHVGRDRNGQLKEFYASSNSYLQSLKKNDNCGYVEFVEVCAESFPAGGAVLDCGCGLGRLAWLLARRGFVVTGVDISPLFIAEAIKKCGEELALRFLVEDARSMSFPDQSFDGVCSALSLEHVGDVKGTLKEMCRVIKGRGVLIVTLPGFLDPVQHLSDFINWKGKAKYKPWEARTRTGALYQFVRTFLLVIAKAWNLNRKIYYLDPILTNDRDACGQDFDATWLANAYDVRNTLSDMGMTVEIVFPRESRGEGRVTRMMEAIGFPESLQRAYSGMRASGFIVVARKNKDGGEQYNKRKTCVE